MKYTAEDCVRSMYDDVEGNSNVGCIGIVDFEKANFKPEYRTPEHQLFRIMGGFGSSPTSGGNAVFGIFCYDGIECRMERYNFIGIANESVTAYAKQLEDKRING